MNSDPKVTVLIPIFNVEPYLRQCLGSLRAQTLRELEVLLLDDGSTDGCPAICDEYAAQDARFRVIHKANSGYGATMNVGLREARGEYIGIVESDDWVESDMFACLYALAREHHVSVVKGTSYEYRSDGTSRLRRNLIPHRDADRVICPAERSAIFYRQPTIWSAIYERSFLRDNNIRFLETPGASYQDTSFNFKVWARAEKVWLSSLAFYHYRVDNAGSSVNCGGKIFCVVDEWNEIERYIAQYPEAEKSSYLLRMHMKWNTYIWNWERLDAAGRAAFEPVFVAAFREVYDRKQLYFASWYPPSKNWIEFCQIMSNHSWKVRYKCFVSRLLRKTVRLFCKTQIKGGVIKYRILCGLIRFHKKAILPHPAEMLPNFGGKLSDPDSLS